MRIVQLTDEKKDRDLSLEGGSTLHESPAESHYHDTDVFGREEDHDVCWLRTPRALPRFVHRRTN